ncbi:hypothetical protein MHU86_16337 [Fragilaria crotonensis]|nr:hypothetical protein MHU86_16337 [Fragilaria crotonensis]
MRHVAPQAFMLEGYPDPQCPSGSSGSDLALPITQQIKTYKDRDLVPRPQVALPIGAIQMAAADSCHPREQATTYLIIMAFYFLLWIGFKARQYYRPPASQPPSQRPHL